jgi:uncharacterized protein (TIGR03000 family)
MKRTLAVGVLLMFALLASPAMRGVTPLLAQEGEAKKVKLKIIVPQDDATLWIFDVKTKQTGTERNFVSSDLKPVKGEYYYELKVFWEPNNYTKITRTRRVNVQPGGSYTVDLSKPDPKDPKDDIVVRYVPTPDSVVDEMAKIAKIDKDDVVFDLGCGDGRMVCRAVAKFHAKRGVGIDLDPERVEDSKKTAKKYKVEDKVAFRKGNVLEPIADLPEATVVMLYMGDDIGARLGPILRKTLKPGARVVSHRFTLGDWKPDKTIHITAKNEEGEDEEYDLHLWVVSAPEGSEKPKEKGEEKVKEKDTGKEKAKP